MTPITAQIDKNTLRALRAQAHALKPIVRLGQNGLSDAVIKELDLALEHHELIKVKLTAEDKSQRLLTQTTLCQSVGAECVQKIGNTMTLYRQKTEQTGKNAKKNMVTFGLSTFIMKPVLKSDGKLRVG